MSGEDFRGQPFQIITSDLKLKQFKCSMKKKKKKGKTSPVPAPQIWAPRVLVLCDSKRHTFQVWTTARTKHNISRCHWGFLEHVTGFYFATRKIVCSPQKWAGISGTSWRILELNGLQKEKLHSVRLNSSRVVLHLPARNPYEKKVQTDVSLAADCVYCHRVDRRRKLCSDMTTTDTRAQLGLFFFFFQFICGHDAWAVNHIQTIKRTIKVQTSKYPQVHGRITHIHTDCTSCAWISTVSTPLLASHWLTKRGTEPLQIGADHCDSLPPIKAH